MSELFGPDIGEGGEPNDPNDDLGLSAPDGAEVDGLAGDSIGLPGADQLALPTAEQWGAADVTILASAFHENWRQTRLQQDGRYEPRVKTTTDKSWITTHGTDQVDIANTAFPGLPADWQEENRAAAEVVVGILGEADGVVDLTNPQERSRVGSRIHDAWLSRNEWAKATELRAPFDQLHILEQDKDLEQLRVGQQVLDRRRPYIRERLHPGYDGPSR